MNNQDLSKNEIFNTWTHVVLKCFTNRLSCSDNIIFLTSWAQSLTQQTGNHIYKRTFAQKIKLHYCWKNV